MSAWSHRATLLGMAPLLLAQGRHVRRSIPMLPEAAGARAGRVGAGPALRLLVAGDSAAAGVGVVHQDQALAGQLVSALAGRYDVHWQLIAKTGDTTQDLLRRLPRDAVGSFDTAVLSLGVNDVTAGARRHARLRRQRLLADFLIERLQVRHVFLSSVGPMDKMSALPHPLRWALGERAKRFNQALFSAVHGWPNCEVVELMLSDEPGAIAADGFHPGWLTYQRWAGHVAGRITEVFGPG